MSWRSVALLALLALLFLVTKLVSTDKLSVINSYLDAGFPGWSIHGATEIELGWFPSGSLKVRQAVVTHAHSSCLLLVDQVAATFSIWSVAIGRPQIDQFHLTNLNTQGNCESLISPEDRVDMPLTPISLSNFSWNRNSFLSFDLNGWSRFGEELHVSGLAQPHAYGLKNLSIALKIAGAIYEIQIDRVRFGSRDLSMERGHISFLHLGSSLEIDVESGLLDFETRELLVSNIHFFGSWIANEGQLFRFSGDTAELILAEPIKQFPRRWAYVLFNDTSWFWRQSGISIRKANLELFAIDTLKPTRDRQKVVLNGAEFENGLGQVDNLLIELSNGTNLTGYLSQLVQKSRLHLLAELEICQAESSVNASEMLNQTIPWSPDLDFLVSFSVCDRGLSGKWEYRRTEDWCEISVDVPNTKLQSNLAREMFRLSEVANSTELIGSSRADLEGFCEQIALSMLSSETRLTAPEGVSFDDLYDLSSRINFPELDELSDLEVVVKTAAERINASISASSVFGEISIYLDSDIGLINGVARAELPWCSKPIKLSLENNEVKPLNYCSSDAVQELKDKFYDELKNRSEG